MTPAQWTETIRQVESGGHANSIGDGGRAFSSYQVHPDWLWQWATTLSIEPKLNERWDDWIGRVVLEFAQFHSAWDPLELAMYFHLGHRSHPDKADWDKAYADRFIAKAVA